MHESFNLKISQISTAKKQLISNIKHPTSNHTKNLQNVLQHLHRQRPLQQDPVIRTQEFRSFSMTRHHSMVLPIRIGQESNGIPRRLRAHGSPEKRSV
jgi:hypothetical protein